MSNFFDEPILNNPYEYPNEHWELVDGAPTNKVESFRRPCSYITPIPKSKKRKKDEEQPELLDQKVSVDGVDYDVTDSINRVRTQVDTWRKLPEGMWGVTPTTARLLRHWRKMQKDSSVEIRPFFCQLEAVETAIWLAEVAPRDKKKFDYRKYLVGANAEPNPELFRIALKLATGAGKTMVMAMLIAWQTANWVRASGSKKYTRAFLIVAPGITIRDRLRVLLPNDAESYYRERDILPNDLLRDMEKAKVVITNYHAFQPRKKIEVSPGTKRVIEGRDGKMDLMETEGEMVRRVIGDLMGEKIIAINDEAHHCYRMKQGEDAVDVVDDLTGDEKAAAKDENRYARMWISGLEAIQRKVGILTVYDLSATPFFLRGSGYQEGTLFPWTMSDFSLMDAIESGIVKLPRVPIADNTTGSGDMPKYRDLWEHIRKDMPKGKGGKPADPERLPQLLYSGLNALYGHYKDTFELWQKAGMKTDPVFIVVCANVKSSKAVYDWISGYETEGPDATITPKAGQLPLFSNFDENGIRRPRPRTLLIDSQQLEAGGDLDKSFRDVYASELDRFKRDEAERHGAASAEIDFSDSEILREMMNTVGEPGRLGADIRCVVSVSMLTEGWDANHVTHIMGVRAFGTQLLCEQVVGRGLRRVSYAPVEGDEKGRFPVEYADILGIPFDFTANSKGGPPQPPPEQTHIKAVRPERDDCEITFPRVEGYRVEFPDEKLQAKFDDDSTLSVTPDDIGPTRSLQSGIVGEQQELTQDWLGDERLSTVSWAIAKHLLYRDFKDEYGQPKMHLMMDLRRICREWIDDHLDCVGNVQPAQILNSSDLEKACDKIRTAITFAGLEKGDRPVVAIIDPYNPVGSTAAVNFRTSKQTLWDPDPTRCHLNHIVCDSDWERQFCRAVEQHPRVLHYAKNSGLGFEVPYRSGGESHLYRPDFLVVIDLGDEPGEGEPGDLLNLIIEVKGFRRENEKDKQNAMRHFWIPGINRLQTYGQWAFAEFSNPYGMDSELEGLIDKAVAEMIEGAVNNQSDG